MKEVKQKLTIESSMKINEFLMLPQFPCSLGINEEEGVVELVKKEGTIRLEGMTDIPTEYIPTNMDSAGDHGKVIINWIYETKLPELLGAVFSNPSLEIAVKKQN